MNFIHLVKQNHVCSLNRNWFKTNILIVMIVLINQYMSPTSHILYPRGITLVKVENDAFACKVQFPLFIPQTNKPN